MTLWTNGLIHTLRRKNEIVHSMLTDGGLIIALGDDVKDYEPTDCIDLGGAHLYPGFIDAHLHLVGYGLSLTIKNISSLKTKPAILAYLKEHFNNEPLLIEGYRDISLSKIDLDTISTNHFIFLRHNDYHSFTVNSAVLEKVKINSKTGVLKEKDAEKVTPLFLHADEKRLFDVTEKAINSLHRYGVTTILTDDLAYFNSYQETLDIIMVLAHKTKMRTHLLVHEKALDDFLASPPKETDFLKVNSVKTFYDGTLSSRSALLSKPYLDTNTNGEHIHTKDQMIAFLKKVRDHQLPLAIHTIGDQAMREVADLLSIYPPLQNQKDRIIHASLVDKLIVSKLAKLNVVLDVQPQFIKSDLPQILSSIGENHLIYSFKTYKNANLALSLTSDAPVERPNPLLGIYAAVTRKGNDGRVYHKTERLTRYQALKGYTIDAAKNLGYKNKGLIKRGYLADFVVFREDILTIPLSKMATQSVLMTIVNGEIIYNDKEKSPR